MPPEKRKKKKEKKGMIVFMLSVKNFIPKKILVLQQRQLGDVIVSTPVFSVLRKRFPHAHIALFTEDKCLPLVLHDPNIDSFEIIYKQGARGFLASFFASLRLYFGIAFRGYDLVVSMQQLPRCQMATFFSFARVRLAFYPRHAYRKVLYNLYPLEKEYAGYVGDIRPQILTPLGIEPTYEKPCLYLTEEERERGRYILSSVGIATLDSLDRVATLDSPDRLVTVDSLDSVATSNTEDRADAADEFPAFITLDATHKHDRNRWAHYKDLVKCILDAYPDFFIFLLRAPGEEEQLREILELDPKRVVMPEKAPSIRESMACMSYASFHIGNTSAPAHMAVALGVPCLVVLARTHSEWHCPPHDQYAGRARQVEVRLGAGILENYLQDIAQQQNTQEVLVSDIQRDTISQQDAVRADTVQADPHAALNLISPKMVMDVFDDLVKNPHY